MIPLDKTHKCASIPPNKSTMRGILTGIGGIIAGFSGIMTGIGRIMTEPSSWRNSSYIDPVSTYAPPELATRQTELHEYWGKFMSTAVDRRQ